jgi:hypothetical protein
MHGIDFFCKNFCCGMGNRRVILRAGQILVMVWYFASVTHKAYDPHHSRHVHSGFVGTVTTGMFKVLVVEFSLKSHRYAPVQCMNICPLIISIHHHLQYLHFVMVNLFF